MSDRRIKSIVIAGPGFTKERLLAYLGRDKDVYRISSLENASNGGRAGVSEVIRRGALTKVLEEIRLVEESDLMGELLRRLGKEEKTAVYGRDEVVKAAQFGAIETMLITDRLLRGAQAEDRAKLDTLLRTVEKARGKVVILSADNEPGEQLSSLGGIAALLRFAIA